ncbi:MAG: tRNA-binding protein [Chitinophagales bacterium]|nr:tRNA-binding protein [Chitinophagales bacterium]MDW8428199.1 tRNA-binding protein [Chitinophagales bacterium]
MISPELFADVDIRVGTVVEAQPLTRARKPAYCLIIDFGPMGFRQSSAQITDFYRPEQLVGRQVIAVLNLPVKLIAGFRSECLVLGVMTQEGVVLLQPERPVPNGERIG